MAGDWFSDGSSANAVDVAQLLTAEVVDSITAVLATGALVSLGTSGDGGSLGCTVTSDGQWRREWFRDADEMGRFLLGAATYLQTAPAQPRQRNRQRGTRGT
jgi:hypothetical protein